MAAASQVAAHQMSTMGLFRDVNASIDSKLLLQETLPRQKAPSPHEQQPSFISASAAAAFDVAAQRMANPVRNIHRGKPKKGKSNTYETVYETPASVSSSAHQSMRRKGGGQKPENVASGNKSR